MTVRAKFKVDSIERLASTKPVFDADGKPVMNHGGIYQKYEPCEIRSIKLSPVYGDGNPEHENTRFWQATPSGSIQLGVINLEAAEGFELHKEYYVDFTQAP